MNFVGTFIEFLAHSPWTGRRDRRHGCHEHWATQDHELSLSDGVLLLAFGSVHEVDGLGQAFLE